MFWEHFASTLDFHVTSTTVLAMAEMSSVLVVVQRMLSSLSLIVKTQHLHVISLMPYEERM
jgi:hypothetical protein